MDNPSLRPTSLLQETFDLLKAHPISLLLPLVVLGLLGGGGRGRPVHEYRPGDTPWELIPFFAFLGLVALAVVILLFLAYVYGVLMTAKAAFAASQQNRDLDVGEAFREAGPLFVPSIGTFLLYVVVLVVGFLLLLVPGFVAMAGLVPLVAVVVAEGRQGGDAMRRAWDLTKGHKWNLFLALLVIMIANVVGGIVVGWIPVLGGALAGIVNGACLAASVVLGVCAYEHLRRDAPHHAGIVAAPPMP